MKRLFFLAAGMFALGCDDYVFAGLLPSISGTLHTGIAVTAQGCAAFGLAFVMSVPLCAFLSARKSARDVLVTALLVFIAGNAMTLLSSDFAIYLASRFIAGLGAGLFLPVAVAAATQAFDAGSRGRALSVIWGSNSAGAVVGVPLGLWLADAVSWRATVCLILILASMSLAGIAIFQQPLKAEGPPPLREQFRLLVDRRVLEIIGVTLLTATGCLGLYAYMAPMLFGTAMAPEAALSFWNFGGLIGSVAIGYVVDRVGKPRRATAMVIATLLFAVISIPAFRSVPVWGCLPFLLWGAMGWAVVMPQQCSLIELHSNRPSNQEATLMALNSSAVSLGSVLGAGLGGLFIACGFDARNLPYAACIFLLCAVIWQTLLIRRHGLEKMSRATGTAAL